MCGIVGAAKARRFRARASQVPHAGRHTFDELIIAAMRLGKVGAKLGVKVGTEYVKSQLGAIGIGLDAIKAVEKELKSEGLTLGALAAPPPQPGTLAALTTSALLQRQIADSNSKPGK